MRSIASLVEHLEECVVDFQVESLKLFYLQLPGYDPTEKFKEKVALRKLRSHAQSSHQL